MPNYTQDQIRALVSSNKNVRIDFTRDRVAMYGKLVFCKDGEDLLKKNFVRFVRHSVIEEFEGTAPEQVYGDNQHWIGNECFTKIFSIKDFLLIS
jgi:hypothetical protein